MTDYSMMVDFRTASSSGWFWAEKDDLPIAWMPLPEPYKELKTNSKGTQKELKNAKYKAERSGEE